MMPLITLAGIAAIFVLFLILQVWRRYSTKGEAPNAGQLIPVDLEAFENLTDPEEEQYLRANLSPAEFRGVQRSRIRAAKMYVIALSQMPPCWWRSVSPRTPMPIWKSRLRDKRFSNGRYN